MNQAIIKEVLSSQAGRGIQETVVLTKDGRRLWGLRPGDSDKFADWTFFLSETQNGKKDTALQKTII